MYVLGLRMLLLPKKELSGSTLTLERSVVLTVKQDADTDHTQPEKDERRRLTGAHPPRVLIVDMGRLHLCSLVAGCNHRLSGCCPHRMSYITLCGEIYLLSVIADAVQVSAVHSPHAQFRLSSSSVRF